MSPKNKIESNPNVLIALSVIPNEYLEQFEVHTNTKKELEAQGFVKEIDPTTKQEVMVLANKNGGNMLEIPLMPRPHDAIIRLKPCDEYPVSFISGPAVNIFHQCIKQLYPNQESSIFDPWTDVVFSAYEFSKIVESFHKTITREDILSHINSYGRLMQLIGNVCIELHYNQTEASVIYEMLVKD